MCHFRFVLPCWLVVVADSLTIADYVSTSYASCGIWNIPYCTTIVIAALNPWMNQQFTYSLTCHTSLYFVYIFLLGILIILLSLLKIFLIMRSLIHFLFIYKGFFNRPLKCNIFLVIRYNQIIRSNWYL